MSTTPRRLEDALRSAGFRGEIRAEAPLATCTTWQIGGPAEILARPVDRDDLRCAVGWASAGSIPWRVLGNGSNILVRDEGVRGLVLLLRRALDHVAVDGSRIEAGAGASFPALANLAAARGLAGLEFAAGIPGTVGGAVVMNAGWHEHETGAAVAAVEFLDTDGSVRTFDRTSCRFGYRSSAFRDRPGVVLGAAFELEPGDAAAIRARLDAFAASRRATQPTDQPSCGSVYLKPPGDFAGRLIERAGLKGTRVGDIQVSPRHANFFVNLGSGTARDAMALMQRVEADVERKFGVRLQREVEIW